MKAELMKKILPITEEFVDKTLSQFQDLSTIRKSIKQEELNLSLQVDEQKTVTDRLKQKEKDNRESFDKKISQLGKELDEAKEAKERYTQLESELRQTREETKAVNEKAKLELAVQKDNTEISKEGKEKARIAEERYNKLIRKLTKDQDEMSEREAQIAIDRNKIGVREKDAENKMRDNIDESHRLNMLDLEIKAREKEVARLIKMYKLEQQIGV